jgi:AraC family transcriptional regulator
VVVTRHAFQDTPDQARQLEYAYPNIVNEGMFGIRQNWDVPLALWRARAGFDASYAGHEHHTLSFLLRGAAAERMDGRFAGRCGAPDGESFMLYVDGHSRRYVSRGDIQVCQMYFQPSFVHALAREESGMADPGMELRDDRVFARDRALRGLTDCYLTRARDSACPPSTLEMDARAVLIGVHLLQRHSNRSGPLKPLRGGLGARRLAIALDFIDAQLGRDITLGEIAGVVGLSPRHLCTAFRRSTGKTPHVYVTEQRIERAKQLLRAGSAPLAEIALECAFGSQPHFTTAFRKATGLTPGAWRACQVRTPSPELLQ